MTTIDVNPGGNARSSTDNNNNAIQCESQVYFYIEVGVEARVEVNNSTTAQQLPEEQNEALKSVRGKLFKLLFC